MNTPTNILNYRKEQCRLCPTPCEHQGNTEWLSEGANPCPKSRFMIWESFKRVPLRGLGDAVAALAEPIAAASDAVFKTKIKGCSACRKRREMLNTLMPFQKL